VSESIIGIPDNVGKELLSHAGNELNLQEIATDLQKAHKELDEYYHGSLVLAQDLKELRLKAEREGNCELAETIHNIEQSAIAVSLRISTDATQ